MKWWWDTVTSLLSMKNTLILAPASPLVHSESVDLWWSVCVWTLWSSRTSDPEIPQSGMCWWWDAAGWFVSTCLKQSEGGSGSSGSLLIGSCHRGNVCLEGFQIRRKGVNKDRWTLAGLHRHGSRDGFHWILLLLSFKGFLSMKISEVRQTSCCFLCLSVRKLHQKPSSHPSS